jgi:thiol-disulfide isomerase/thioredoxin
MPLPENAEQPRKPARLIALIGPLLALAILAPASLYALGAFDNLIGTGKGANAACAATAPVTQRLKPLAKGEVAALQVREKPEQLSGLAFNAPDGKPLSLESFRGKAILLNLWATWCAPCRHEMPALGKLQAELGGADFEVVAVNIDTRNLDKPKQFLEEVKVANLAYYADPSAKIFQELKARGRAFGMPTTILIDKSGCELAYLAGPAEWASPDAMAFVRVALGR